MSVHILNTLYCICIYLVGRGCAVNVHGQNLVIFSLKLSLTKLDATEV